MKKTSLYLLIAGLLLILVAYVLKKTEPVDDLDSSENFDPDNSEDPIEDIDRDPNNKEVTNE